MQTNLQRSGTPGREASFNREPYERERISAEVPEQKEQSLF